MPAFSPKPHRRRRSGPVRTSPFIFGTSLSALLRPSYPVCLTPATRAAQQRLRSIRRECLDHIVVFGEAHLRRIRKAYVSYYNAVPTHLSLNKDAPIHRPVQRFGRIISVPVLGGVYHQYCGT